MRGETEDVLLVLFNKQREILEQRTLVFDHLLSNRYLSVSGSSVTASSFHGLQLYDEKKSESSFRDFFVCDVL
jgi:hypothetical protein